MKRWLYLLVISIAMLLALASSAAAQIECGCSGKECACFIQLGDEGIAVEAIADLLHDMGYLSSPKGNRVDQKIHDAVCRFQDDCGIMETGLMDDDTLSLLIWGVYADEMETSAAVWVPVNGGKKRHKNPGCSGMEHPRTMSALNAQALGIEACKRCKPE